MKNTNVPTPYQLEIEEIIEMRCLPEDAYESVYQILKNCDEEQVREDLDIFTAECYRMEPNHARYDKRRDVYPSL